MKNCVVSKNKLFAIEKTLQNFNKKLFLLKKKKITLGESIL